MGKRLQGYLKNFSWCVFLYVLASCSSTKHVPQGEYLLDDVRVETDSKLVKPSDLSLYVRQRPNTKWFNLIKTQLYIYNLSGTDTTRWVNRALRRVGDAPVLFSSAETDRSRQELEKAVRNMGYMGAQARAESRFNGKKVSLTYRVATGKPYTVRSIAYDIPDSTVWGYMRRNPEAGLLREGMNMDINTLDKERERITGLLQHHGYYKFNKEYLTFTADTARGTYMVDLTMHLQPYRVTADSVSPTHPQYYLHQVKFDLSADGLQASPGGRQAADSVIHQGHTVYYNGPLSIRPQVLVNNQFMQEGALYNGQQVQQTYQSFNRLPALRYTNIRFQDFQRNDSSFLDAHILLTRSKQRSVSFEVEGTNSAGDLGAAASVSFNHRNLFRGSELFTLRLRGAYEAVSGLQGNYRNESYTELGAEASINFPRFVFPFLSTEYRRRVRASTQLSMQYNFQLRPEFTRIVASTGWSYQWGRTQRTRHRVDLLDVNYLYMPWIHPDFKDRYLDRQDNYILRYNYEDRFIVRTGYTYTYNSSGTNSKLTNNVFSGTSHSVRLSVEAAGNLLYGLSHLAGIRRNQQGEFSILDIPYAQYAKIDFDYSKNINIDPRNSVAYHVAVGLAYPYGNARMIPFEKRYFAGGANSVRGWSVRSLGPGSFAGDGNFMNQTGDVKLDLSVEYRSRLFRKLMGAAFIDAGNIWTLRDYENQPGGQFRLGEFYRQIAVAYGIGLRLDLDFFVVRFDGGMKAVNPVFRGGRDRYPIIHPNLRRDFAFHFAVGYPF